MSLVFSYNKKKRVEKVIYIETYDKTINRTTQNFER